VLPGSASSFLIVWLGNLAHDSGLITFLQMFPLLLTGSCWKETGDVGKKRVAKGINMLAVNWCDRRSHSKLTWHELGWSTAATKAYRWSGLNTLSFLNSTLDCGEWLHAPASLSPEETLVPLE